MRRGVDDFAMTMDDVLAGVSIIIRNTKSTEPREENNTCQNHFPGLEELEE